MGHSFSVTGREWKHCTPGYLITLSCEWVLTGSVGSGAAKCLVELEGAGSEQNLPSKTGCQVRAGRLRPPGFGKRVLELLMQEVGMYRLVLGGRSGLHHPLAQHTGVGTSGPPGLLA